MNWYKVAQQGLLFYPYEGRPQDQTDKIAPIGTDPETKQNIYPCSICQNQIIEEDIGRWISPEENQKTPYLMPHYDQERITQAFQEISQYLSTFNIQLQQYIQNNNLDLNNYSDSSQVRSWEVQVPQLPNILNQYPEIGDICSIKRSTFGSSGLCMLFEIGTEINGEKIMNALEYLSNPASIKDFTQYSNEEYEINHSEPVCNECIGELDKCEYCDKPLPPGKTKYPTVWDNTSYVCEECIENGSADTCIECGRADSYEDMRYMEDEGHLCSDCYAEANEKVISWAEESIAKLDLPVGKALPISEKNVQVLEQFFKMYLKKYGDNVLNGQEWGKIRHVIKKAGMPNGALEYLDSISNTYNEGTDSYSYEKVSDVANEVSNVLAAQEYMKEQYPGLKSYQDIPYDIDVVKNYGSDNDGQGFTIAISPSDTFLEYGKNKFPNIENVWSKMNYTPHHPGYLAYARCTFELGDTLVVNNLQRDADFDNFKSKTYRENSPEDIAAAKWIDRSTKNWDSFLLDIIKSLCIANDTTAFLTTFDMQKQKWGNLPIHKSRKTYEEVPNQMGFQVGETDGYRVENLIEQGGYAPEMYQIANVIGNWYKVAQQVVENPTMPYYEIGHEGEGNFKHSKPNFMWLFSNGVVNVVEETDMTPEHQSAFPDENIENFYSGRYESDTGRLSVMIPYSQKIQIIRRQVPSMIMRLLRNKFPEIQGVYVYV